MYKTLPVAAVGVLAFGVLAGCTTMTSTQDPMYLKVQDLDARVQRVEKVVNNQSLVQLATEVDQLKAQLRELRGQIEALQHDSENATARQRQLYLDVDRRLQALEQGGGPGGVSPGAGSGTGSPGFGSPTDATPSSPNAGDAGSARGGDLPTAGATGSTSGAGGSDQASYQAAFNLIQGRKYAEAETAFGQFLVNYPRSVLADNAQYWLGETHYVQGDYSGALNAFQKVIEQFPQSAKVPDALLKVGYCQAQLKQLTDARATLQKVTTDYPDTTAARLAQQRLEALGSPAG